MKVIVKLVILIAAMALAVGGVMVYVKTRVEPPTAFQPINQFEEDLNQAYSKLENANSVSQQDAIYRQTIDRISVFEKEKRLTRMESDRHKGELLGRYSPIFLNRCFAKFDARVWHAADHNYMLAVSARLKSVKKSDGKLVLHKSTLDSLALVEKIISDYRQARAISRNPSYKDVSKARNTIDQAENFAKNKYLSRCTELRNALNGIKAKIAKSHYAYISSQVNKLLNYGDYYQQEYDKTLSGITEYEENADALYESNKEDVGELLSKVKKYYDEHHYDKSESSYNRRGF